MITLCLLIFVKPEQIPHLMRKLGRSYGRLVGMSQRVQNEVDRLAREAELGDPPQNSVLAPTENPAGTPDAGTKTSESQTEEQ